MSRPSEDNCAYIRRLLWEKDPGYALFLEAATEAAVREALAPAAA